jgi:hypothetical protein
MYSFSKYLFTLSACGYVLLTRRQAFPHGKRAIVQHKVAHQFHHYQAAFLRVRLGLLGWSAGAFILQSSAMHVDHVARSCPQKAQLFA